MTNNRFKRTGKRDSVFLATKFGSVLDQDVVKDGLAVCGTPEFTRKALEASLKKLQTDHIDLWYLHRYVPSRHTRSEDLILTRL